MHPDPHPLAGQAVTISEGVQDPADGTVTGGMKCVIVDWWDRLTGHPWGQTGRNPACIYYAMRAAANMLPPDDEVVYAKTDALPPRGYLVHVSEIDW